MPQSDITLTYDEAMAICLLIAEAADAAVDDGELRGTWAEEARLVIDLVLNRPTTEGPRHGNDHHD